MAKARTMSLSFLVVVTALLVPGEAQLWSQAGPEAVDPEGRAARQRPYIADSPWNLRIGPDPVYDELSDELTASLKGTFGCDPTQYTYPVYDQIDEHTPFRTISLSGIYSDVTDRGRRLSIRKQVKVPVPVPAPPVASLGRDGQIIFINPLTGDEWGFWKLDRSPEGVLTARNGYHYNVNWYGVPPMGFVSRGAGVPYLAGLVRPSEIRQGRIDHALAFGCNTPNSLFVFPATKSDGHGAFPSLPEGARLQLDPRLTDRDFDEWKLSKAGKIIARALQDYGMIVVDGSGHPKIYVEDEHTAQWKGVLEADTVKPIPYSAFRVLSLTAPAPPLTPPHLSAVVEPAAVVLRWESSHMATRYRVKRRRKLDDEFTMLNPQLTELRYVDTALERGASYEYSVQAVSHNGVSEGATIQVTAPR